MIGEETTMSESTNAIASLKKAADLTKLAMHREGPRSFKRGQGALIKVIYEFGSGTLAKDAAKKTLGWRGCDVRDVAKKAAENGYLTIENPQDGFVMSLTELGTEVIKKRLVAEDKAADEVLGALTDEEKRTLISLCDKIRAKAEDMGISYEMIQKKRGKRCGKECSCHHRHHHGHACKKHLDGTHEHGKCHKHHEKGHKQGRKSKKR